MSFVQGKGPKTKSFSEFAIMKILCGDEEICVRFPFIRMQFLN
jgi:hypothetical protein